MGRPIRNRSKAKRAWGTFSWQVFCFFTVFRFSLSFFFFGFFFVLSKLANFKIVSLFQKVFMFSTFVWFFFSKNGWNFKKFKIGKLLVFFKKVHCILKKLPSLNFFTFYTLSVKNCSSYINNCSVCIWKSIHHNKNLFRVYLNKLFTVY